MSEIHSIFVPTYSELAPWRDDFLKPAGLNFLLVIGTAGSGKTRMFRSHAGDDVFYHEGPMSGPKFYTALYEHRDQAIILDDVDILLKHADNINLMKLLCQTDSIMRLSWRKQNWRMEEQNVPDSFQTTSRVCVLANKISAVEENLGAVLDRARVIEFRPSVEEVHRQVATWLPKEHDDIYAFIGSHLGMLPDPSMRWYEKAVEDKRLDRPWRARFLNACTKNPKLSLVAQVVSDPTLKTSEAKVKRFAELGGGSRDTFFRYQKQYQEMRQVKRTNTEQSDTPPVESGNADLEAPPAAA